MLSDAAFAMAQEATAQHDDARVAKLGAFHDRLLKYDNEIVPVWQAISGIGGEPLANAGDIFDVAANSEEPMWQIEATLKLGRMRFMNNVTLADQRGAVRILKQMAENSDLPYPIRIAAEKGRDLKVEEFRKIGGGS